jgi:hypothetical protein
MTTKLEQAARQIIVDWDSGIHLYEAIAALRKALAEQAERRPQNCGTGYCSCIECPYEAKQAEQEPVAWALSHSFGLEFSSKYPMQTTKEAAEQMARQHMGAVVVTPLYAAPIPVTTPDVCGEVCARAKLCYGCNKDLEEANSKLAEQAGQEPVAFQAREIGEGDWFDVGLDEVTRITGIINSPHIDYRWLYAAPVRTKDLTDDEERQIITATVEGVTTSELAMFKAVARAVIAADREKNK